jgi:hypothetical protein
VQVDMKRLLAYSSIENIGIIVMGLGLAIIFQAYQMHSLAALALTALLYHCLNHAIFKSLLFLGTGSVLHATHRAKPRQARGPNALHAVGRVDDARRGDRERGPAAVERLRLRVAPDPGFPLHRGPPNPYLKMLVPMFAAGPRARRGAGGLCDGEVLRGDLPRPPREERLSEATDAGAFERLGLLWLTAGCICSGSFPWRSSR